MKEVTPHTTSGSGLVDNRGVLLRIYVLFLIKCVGIPKINNPTSILLLRLLLSLERDDEAYLYKKKRGIEKRFISIIDTKWNYISSALWPSLVGSLTLSALPSWHDISGWCENINTPRNNTNLHGNHIHRSAVMSFISPTHPFHSLRCPFILLSPPPPFLSWLGVIVRKQSNNPRIKGRM